jgi:hypothetical protein
MMLLQKLAKERELDPCKHWVVPVLDSYKEKIRRFREAQEKNFLAWTEGPIIGILWDLIFPIYKPIGAAPRRQ